MRYVFFYFLTMWCYHSLSQSNPTNKNILFAHTPERDLNLDLYFPDGNTNPYLVIWVHGGAWHSGSKERPPLELLKKGYALASIEYRLTVEARYPAQIYDIKAAVRFLRANAATYGIHSDKIFIWGLSAGGHLATLTGVTNDNKELEGKVGDFLNTSSNLQGIIDFFGPTDLTTILSQSTPHGISVRSPALVLMFGKPIDQIKEELKQASPVFHVTADDPPLFICHGDQDIQVPVNQSIQLYGKYKELNLPVQIEYAYGAGHGGKAYSDPVLIDKVDQFLKLLIKD